MANGQLAAEFPTPVRGPNGLQWTDEGLWAVDQWTDDRCNQRLNHPSDGLDGRDSATAPAKFVLERPEEEAE